VNKAKVWFVTPASECRVGVLIHYKNGKHVASRVVSTNLQIWQINDQLRQIG